MMSGSGFALLAALERTGKTSTALRVAEISKADKILFVSTKKALSGIQEHLDNLPLTKSYTLINYHSLHKLEDTEFDMIILDEAHTALQAYPKASQIQKILKPLTKDKPILYISATFFSESFSQAFHLLQLSSYSPFKSKTFYNWHKEYGVESVIYMNGRPLKQYNLTRESEIKHILSPHTLRATRQDVGFEHEPTDELHYVELNEVTKADLRLIKKDKFKHFKTIPIPLESAASEMNAVYLRGNGFVEHEKDCYCISTEKIDYLLENFGDCKDVAIMAHYVCEQKYLNANLEHATVLSSTADAEGVNLMEFKHLIIYSMGFSTSKHVQRRARQCNINRKDPIIVHFLLTDAGLDKHIYKCVDNKKTNFTKRVYEEIE